MAKSSAEYTDADEGSDSDLQQRLRKVEEPVPLSVFEPSV